MAYKSGYERKVAAWLTQRRIKFEYEKHKLFFEKNVANARCKECSSREVIQDKFYTPDWYLPAYDLIIESKGRLTSFDRTKMERVKKAYPELNLRILFMRNERYGERKTRYVEWAERVGYICAVSNDGSIPSEWVSKRTRRRSLPLGDR